nr:serine/threonine-protein kinase rio2 [Quercus suber]
MILSLEHGRSYHNEARYQRTSVEQGSKNHELVPTPLISQIAGLRGGSGVHRCISTLAKADDGYRLTYGGLDYLALNTHRKGNTIFSLGNQIGVGKESDIYITASPEGRQLVLKLHRLGRISFRTVKANRDYLRNRAAGSWMYLSRLAAQKEHAFMRVLHREGFPVPEPVAWSRHTVVMEFIDAFPLRMIEKVADPGKLYGELMEMIVQLAQRGLIHGDFNEFNLLIREEFKGENVKLIPILIDFPQTISTNHTNAEMYFDRDVACVKRYFEKKLKYTSDEPGPFFTDAIKDADPTKRLDVEVEASGFSRKMFKELDRYVEAVGGDSDGTEKSAAVDEGEIAEDIDGESDEPDSDVDDIDPGEHEIILPANDQPDFNEQLNALSVTDDSAPIQTGPVDYGLVPLDISHDDGMAAEKVKTKKKASGWAI